MPMKEPPHPGLSIRFDCLEPLGLNITAGAKVLGVSRMILLGLEKTNQQSRLRVMARRSPETATILMRLK